MKKVIGIKIKVFGFKIPWFKIQKRFECIMCKEEKNIEELEEGSKFICRDCWGKLTLEYDNVYLKEASKIQQDKKYNRE